MNTLPFGFANIQIMHAALPEQERVLLGRLLATEGFQSRMKFLRDHNGDPDSSEWLHFCDLMLQSGSPVCHHLTAERSNIHPEKSTSRAIRITMLFGPPDLVFEKWDKNILTWSITKAEFWAFNSQILESLKQ